ncbi:MAG: 16S rRNA (guanine(527)-N(7))-methyltransferase RsmG [Gammaproteobacteria bacterium]
MDEADITEGLRSGLLTLGDEVSAEQVEHLSGFLQLLAKWNRAFNLTAVRDANDMVVRHILDSLAVRVFLQGRTVLDVGTGAGLPGIPLAVMEPHRAFTLLDSGGKKIRFLRHVLAELQLGNVEVVHSRVEAYTPEHGYDTVICRAFSSLGDFVSACGRLTTEDGRLLAMKGRYPDQELTELAPPWSTRCEPLRVPGLDGQRHAVLIERTASAAQS